MHADYTQALHFCSLIVIVMLILTKYSKWNVELACVACSSILQIFAEDLLFYYHQPNITGVKYFYVICLHCNCKEINNVNSSMIPNDIKENSRYFAKRE